MLDAFEKEEVDGETPKRRLEIIEAVLDRAITRAAAAACLLVRFVPIAPPAGAAAYVVSARAQRLPVPASRLRRIDRVGTGRGPHPCGWSHGARSFRRASKLAMGAFSRSKARAGGIAGSLVHPASVCSGEVKLIADENVDHDCRPPPRRRTPRSLCCRTRSRHRRRTRSPRTQPSNERDPVDPDKDFGELVFRQRLVHWESA